MCRVMSCMHVLLLVLGYCGVKLRFRCKLKPAYVCEAKIYISLGIVSHAATHAYKINTCH